MTGRVVAIAGPPGAGKSTLAQGLAARIGACLVAWDDFERQTRRSPQQMADWQARGAPYGEISAPGLIEALKKARQAGSVVFDMPLGRAWPPAATLIDVVVWIDVPHDVALARKIAQLAPSPESGDERGFLNWVTGYLAAYPAVVRPAITDQAARVRGDADILCDGQRPPQQLVDEIAGNL